MAANEDETRGRTGGGHKRNRRRKRQHGGDRVAVASRREGREGRHELQERRGRKVAR